MQNKNREKIVRMQKVMEKEEKKYRQNKNMIILSVLSFHFEGEKVAYESNLSSNFPFLNILMVLDILLSHLILHRAWKILLRTFHITR